MRNVVPLVGTWIEIHDWLIEFYPCNVVPLVGTWIEISRRLFAPNYQESFPSWERGLKLASTDLMSFAYHCRSPRGNVD